MLTKKSETPTLKSKALTCIRGAMGILGLLFFVLIVLSFTDVPYYAYYYLSLPQEKLERKPDLIVVLGGSGMPSPDGLIRTYYAAEAANRFKEAAVIIALPYNENDSLKQLKLMAHELILRGVDSLRIRYEPFGFNTHSQATNIAQRYKNEIQHVALLMVTSPEHMYRSVNTFRKAGFPMVAGLAAFERPPDETGINDKAPGSDTRVKNLSLRYNMWSYLNYEVLVLREYFAIIYYKLKGWC
jgi:uncharacterized SAM-binding protein YcdF (DUF218 family)